MEITPRPQAKIALHIILACLSAIGLKAVTETKDTYSVKKEFLFLRIVFKYSSFSESVAAEKSNTLLKVLFFSCLVSLQKISMMEFLDYN